MSHYPFPNQFFLVGFCLGKSGANDYALRFLYIRPGSFPLASRRIKLSFRADTPKVNPPDNDPRSEEEGYQRLLFVCDNKSNPSIKKPLFNGRFLCLLRG